MARLKFDMWLSQNKGIVFSFTDGKGRYRQTWFGAPPDSIDHVSPGYIYDRLPNAKNEHHCEFIKRRYKEEFVKVLPQVPRTTEYAQ